MAGLMTICPKGFFVNDTRLISYYETSINRDRLLPVGCKSAQLSQCAVSVHQSDTADGQRGAASGSGDRDDSAGCWLRDA